MDVLGSSIFLPSLKTIHPSVFCKLVLVEAVWPHTDSADRRSFIVTDGSTNTMKSNLNSVVCLYLYACMLAEIISMR